VSGSRCIDREPVVEQRDLAGRVEHGAEPAAHRGHRGVKLGRDRVAGRRQQSGQVDEVAEHLAVIRGRALVVAAVWQQLDLQLPADPAQGPAEQRVVTEEDRQAGQRLEVLDEVVAPHVGLEVTAQEPGERGQLASVRSLDTAAANQPREQTAERPGAQRGRIRVPGRTATPADRRVPRPPGCAEHGPRVLGRQL
jgi:hypothetical protein